MSNFLEDLLRGAQDVASRAWDQVNQNDGGKDWNQRTATPQKKKETRPQPRTIQYSPQVQRQMAQQEQALKQSQANVFNPLAVIGDVAKATQDAGKGIGSVLTDTVNGVGNRIADGAEAGAEIIREMTGENQAAYNEANKRAAEYRQMAQSFAQRAAQEQNPARRQAYIDQIRNLGMAESNELDRQGADIQRGLAATDPRKTLTNAAETVLDVATAGRGTALLKGLQPAATQVTRQTLGQLGKNAARTTAEGAALGAGYGTIGTAKDENATIQDYFKNAGTGALVGGALGLGAQVAAPVAGKVVKATADAGAKKLSQTVRKHEEMILKNAAQDSPLTTVRQEYINPTTKKLDPAVISQHKKAILNGNIDPIIVSTDNTGYVNVLDGEHRLAAYKELGVETVPTRSVSPAQLRMMKQGGYAKVPGTKGTISDEITPTIQSSQKQNGILHQAMLPDKTSGMDVMEYPDRLSIVNATIKDESLRGKGIGKKMYGQMIELANKSGKPLMSDATVEFPAVRVWESLKRNGHNVIENPNAKSLEDGTKYMPNLKDPVYTLAPAQKPGQKLSKFANKTVQNADEVSTPLKKLVKEEKVAYKATTNAERSAVSKALVNGKPTEAVFNKVLRDLETAKRGNRGQAEFNAIELAKKLDESTNEDSLFKATEIYRTLSEQATAKGQEIQALAYLNNRTPQGLRYGAQRDIEKALKKPLTPEQQKIIKGHTDEIKKYAIGTDERNFAVHELAKYVSSQIPSGMGNKIINVWRAGLLTAPTTTGGNILGNAGEAVVRKGFVNPVATAADALMSLKTGKRTMTLNGGFAGGAKEGGGKLKRFMKTGYDERNALSKYDAKELNYGNDGIGKLVGNYVNGTYRLMSVADQPFWYGARREALSSIAKAEALNKGLKGQARKDAIAEFIKNPPKEAMERATKEAKYGTFQNETTLGTAAGSLKQGLRQRSDIAGAAADFFIPFTQVPSAIATRVIKRTPIGTAEEAVKQFIKVKKGGQFDQRAMAQAIAEGSFGPAVFAAGYALANSGQLTFGFPEDAKERELWEAEGKQPYSVRLGDRWYSLNYLQPFGTLLSVGGEAANAEKDGANPGETISRGIATAAQAVMNQSFLKGISGVLDAIDNPKQYAQNYVSNTAGSIIPNFARSFARATDPMQREQKGALAGIQGSIPGLRQGLPEKMDMFGQEMEAKDTFLNQYLNPLRPSKVRDTDGTIAELRRLKDLDEGVLPSAAKKDAYGDLGKLTDSQVHELNSRAGKAMKAEYDKLINTAEYKALDDATKAKSLKNINTDVYGAIKHNYGIEQGFAMDTRKLSNDQKAYINGEANSFLAKASKPGGGSSSTAVSPSLAKSYKDTLKEFDALSTEERDKKIYNENDAEYRLENAKYENAKANGTLTKAEAIKAQDKLSSLKIGSKFSKETRELYSLNKTQLTSLIDKGEITEKQANDILALSDAFAATGKTNKFRDKNGNIAIRPKAKGGSGGRKKGTAKGKIPKSDDNTSTINLVANLSRKAANAKVAKRALPTGGGIRAPGIQAYKKTAKTNVSMTRKA